MFSEEHLALLKQGVNKWNSWRTANPGIDPNLMNADLSNVDLREVDLSDANLVMSDLRWANLSKANLSRAFLMLILVSQT